MATLPNFDILQDNMQTVGANLGLLRNLPQVNVQQQIAELQQSVNKLEQNMQRSVSRLEQSIGNLDTNITAISNRMDTAITTMTDRMDIAITNVTNLITTNSQRINNINNRMDNFDNALANLTNVVTASFARLDTRLNVLENNATSRALNGHLRGGQQLFPIVDQQGQPIPNLPQTPDAFVRIKQDGQLINSFLLQLGVTQNAIPHIILQRYHLLLHKMGMPTV